MTLICYVLSSSHDGDQWDVSENIDWITLVKEDLGFRVNCEINNTLDTRSGNINLSGGGEMLVFR